MSEKSVCMDAIPQGVFILGTRMGDSYNLMTAAFVTQVSFNPCSVAVSVANNHYTAELIAQQGQFSLSVLAEGQEAEAKAMELLTRVGLQDKADNYPQQLSGGQKQRVACRFWKARRLGWFAKFGRQWNTRTTRFSSRRSVIARVRTHNP